MRPFQDSGVCNDHTFGRCAIFPKFSDRDQGYFNPIQLFEVSEIKVEDGDNKKPKGTGIYALSLASEILGPGEHGVHEYGQRSAVRMTSGFQERTGRLPDPGITYLAYYTIRGQAVYSYEARHHCLKIKWYPEYEEVCHFQIEIYCTDPESTKIERRNERLKIVEHVVRNIEELKVLPEAFRKSNEASLIPLLEDVETLRKRFA